LRRSGVEGVKGVQAIVRQAKGKTPRKASALEKTGFFFATLHELSLFLRKFAAIMDGTDYIVKKKNGKSYATRTVTNKRASENEFTGATSL
jgi:hypothetical protein